MAGLSLPSGSAGGTRPSTNKPVMAGLVPAIQVFFPTLKFVDARHFGRA
jgi:hypothetical protein